MLKPIKLTKKLNLSSRSRSRISISNSCSRIWMDCNCRSRKRIRSTGRMSCGLKSWGGSCRKRCSRKLCLFPRSNLGPMCSTKTLINYNEIKTQVIPDCRLARHVSVAIVPSALRLRVGRQLCDQMYRVPIANWPLILTVQQLHSCEEACSPNDSGMPLELCRRSTVPSLLVVRRCLVTKANWLIRWRYSKDDHAHWFRFGLWPIGCCEEWVAESTW